MNMVWSSKALLFLNLSAVINIMKRLILHPLGIFITARNMDCRWLARCLALFYNLHSEPHHRGKLNKHTATHLCVSPILSVSLLFLHYADYIYPKRVVCSSVCSQWSCVTHPNLWGRGGRVMQSDQQRYQPACKEEGKTVKPLSGLTTRN